MNINWQWPSAIIFCVVTLVLGGLIYAGKLPASALSALVAWLIPSPIKTPAPEQKTTIEVKP